MTSSKCTGGFVFSSFRGYALQKHLPSTVPMPGIAAPSYMVSIDSAATSPGGASSAPTRGGQLPRENY
jgi:hypothetical protein